jgi:hypothetical protein
MKEGWLTELLRAGEGEERRVEIEPTGSFAKCNCQRGRVARRSAGTKLLL